MSPKIKVGIMFGGKSAEHEVSVRSAKNVIDALDKEKYEPILIFISKQGEWFWLDKLDQGGVDELHGRKIAFIPQGSGRFIDITTHQSDMSVDVVFPVLHGPFGEDGTMQGLLKIAHVPCVGAGVLGSALGMDKDVMKRLLRDAGVPVARFLVARGSSVPTYADVSAKFGLPFFVKPANLGSSVGVNKVHSESEFVAALADAFQYDTKVLIEEYIDGREIECAVLGNETPRASVLGEIIVSKNFYSYDEKYKNGSAVSLEIPAQLPEEIVSTAQALAIKTFTVLECEGLGRVDFFLTRTNNLYVNEINTIPGFTSVSMYPKMWEASGISYTELIDRLIQLALQRFEKEQKIKTVL